MNESKIIIYHSKEGDISLSIDVGKDTIWATQAQIAELFGVQRPAITKHIKNIYQTGELAEDKVCSVLEHTTPHGAREGKTQTHTVSVFNLDMILSIGYRVNSTRATEFRKWANSVLREYVLNGVAINYKRLEQVGKIVDIISRSDIPELAGISAVLEQYTRGLQLLDDYDHQSLSKPKGDTSKWKLEYNEAREFVDAMSFAEGSALFGKEKDDSFKSALGSIYQTFSGEEVYPSIQEKAANLLYFVVKDHAFVDGNKRIAAALFVHFLERNNALADGIGRQRISNSALAAITLMVALSRPEEKDVMCLLVMNMLC